MLQLSPVSFHGDTIFCIEHHCEPYVPMRPIVENLGMDWSAQAAKIRTNHNRWGVAVITTPSAATVGMIATVAKDGKEREMLCLPLRKLAAWLASINPKKVRQELRAKIELYQAESDDALWNYWMNGHAERKTYAEVNTKSQQDILQTIIDALVAKASESGKPRRILYAQIWNSFRRYFGLGKNDKLPQSRMSEAIIFLVQLELEKKQKAIPNYQEGPERIDSFKFDRMRKQIIEDLDQIDKKLVEISSLVKWQLCPTSKDAGFTQDKMNFFYMLLHLNNMALGGIYTARQALAIAGKMKE